LGLLINSSIPVVIKISLQSKENRSNITFTTQKTDLCLWQVRPDFALLQKYSYLNLRTGDKNSRIDETLRNNMSLFNP